MREWEPDLGVRYVSRLQQQLRGRKRNDHCWEASNRGRRWLSGEKEAQNSRRSSENEVRRLFFQLSQDLEEEEKNTDSKL